MKNRIINISQQYYDKNKKFPPLDKLGDKLGLTPKGLRVLLRELEEEGIIRRHNSRYYLSSWFSPAIVKKPFVAPVRNVTPPKKFNNPVLAGVFFLLSLGAFAFSTYYSYLYLGGFIPGIPGLGFSLLFVLLAATGFLTARILWRMKHPGLSITIGFLGFITMLFSMFCTMSGLYELKQSTRIDNKHIDLVLDKNESLEILYKQQISDADISIKSKESEIKTLQNKMETANEKETRTYIWRMGIIQKDLTPIQNQKKDTEELLRSLLLETKDSPQRNLTIFESLSMNIFINWNPNTLEFLINLFPVLLIDFLATFGPLIFSIFIEKKED